MKLSLSALPFVYVWQTVPSRPSTGPLFKGNDYAETVHKHKSPLPCFYGPAKLSKRGAAWSIYSGPSRVKYSHVYSGTS